MVEVAIVLVAKPKDPNNPAGVWKVVKRMGDQELDVPNLEGPRELLLQQLNVLG